MNLPSKNLLLAVVALVALFLPEMAHAFPFTPSGDDKSRIWFIQGLFGGLDGGGGDDPLASIIGVFNGAVLALGGVLLFYTLIAGTMQTAHDGEVLGKRWSSLWLPLRTALGVAMIIPGPSGYALIQHAVIWLALQGIGIADTMHTRFIDTQVISGYTVNTASIKTEVDSVVRSMIMNAACVAAFDDDVASNDANTNALFGQNPFTGQPAGTAVPGQVHSYFYYRYGCGSIVHAPYELPGDNPNAGLQVVNISAIQDMRRAVWQIHHNQYESAIAQTGAVAQQIISNYKAGVPDGTTEQMVTQRANAISDAWVQAAATEAESRISSLTNQEVINAIKADGWIMLGSLYIQLSLGQQAIAEALGIVPEVNISDRLISASNDTLTKEEGAISGFFSGLGRVMMGEKFSINKQSAAAVLYAARTTNAGMSSESGGQSGGDGAAKRAMTGMTGAVVASMTGVDMSGSDKNPVLLAGEMGSRITTSIFVGFGILAVASAVGSIYPGLGTTIAVLGAIISPLMLAMLGAGLSLSYYIPMLPYILWLGAVFGWVVLIVEAVIAAPIWAVTHLAPDGDGVVGRGGQGYMLVLSLTLRPALMVFGFAAAAAVMKPMGLFLNETFMATFFASTSPGFTGFLRILAGSVIYATLMMMIINRVFSLIHQIPDGILRWIGGGDNVIGREANEANAGAGKALAAGAALGSSMSAVNNGTQQLGSALRQHRADQAARKNATAATASQEAGNENDRSSRSLESLSEAVSDLGGSVGTEGYEARAEGVSRQVDSAAMASVSAAESTANSVLANAEAKKPGDPLYPSAEDVSAARDILGSVADAKSSPEKAKSWLQEKAAQHGSNAKFGPQLTQASDRLSNAEATLQSSRGAHASTLGERADKAAMSAVGNIANKATDTIERAGTLSGDDPDYPTQDEISTARQVLDSIESSGAQSSPEAAKNWLSDNAGAFGDSGLGQEVSMAAARASRMSASARGGDTKDLNGLS